MADTGWLAGSTFQSLAYEGSIGWNNPANAATSDNVRTTATNSKIASTSRHLRVTGFNASVPAGATIDGIEVQIERLRGSSGGPDLAVLLVNGTANTTADHIGTNQASATAYTTSDVTASYGGSSNTMGATLTDTIVNGADFGVTLRVTLPSNGTVSVDMIQLKVFYTTGGGGGGSYSLTASAGAIAVGGQAGNLLTGRALSSASSSFTYTGNSAGLSTGKTMPAAGVAYSLAGIDAAFAMARALGGGAGSYALAGTAASLLQGRVVAGEAGAFGALGQSVLFVQGRSLFADPAAYSLVGQSVALAVARVLPATAGGYALAGNDAAMRRFLALAGDVGMFILNGNSASLIAGKLFPAEQGAYAFSGNDATLTALALRALIADAGAFVVTGSASGGVSARRLVAAPNAFALSGNTALFVRARAFSADAAAFALIGNDADLLVAVFRRLAADGGEFELSGVSVAAILRVWSLSDLCQCVDPADESDGGMSHMIIPVDGKTIDWPRRVANAVNTMVRRMGKPIPVPFVVAGSEPASPQPGQTYFDTATEKVRTWDGAAWRDHW